MHFGYIKYIVYTSLMNNFIACMRCMLHAYMIHYCLILLNMS